jgi:hypothetical protein
LWWIEHHNHNNIYLIEIYVIKYKTKHKRLQTIQKNWKPAANKSSSKQRKVSAKQTTPIAQADTNLKQTTQKRYNWTKTIQQNRKLQTAHKSSAQLPEIAIANPTPDSKSWRLQPQKWEKTANQQGSSWKAQLRKTRVNLPKQEPARLSQNLLQIPFLHQQKVLHTNLGRVSSNQSRPNIPLNLLNQLLFRTGNIAMWQIISVPPQMVNCGTKAEFTNSSLKISALPALSTPATNRRPFNRGIINTTVSHNIPPHPSTETTAEKEMITALLASKTGKAQGGTCEAPTTKFLLGDKSIPKHQPQDEGMLWNGQRKPNQIVPFHHRKFRSKMFPSLRTGILSWRRPPNRDILTS